jgi:hypothetical protein
MLLSISQLLGTVNQGSGPSEKTLWPWQCSEFNFLAEVVVLESGQVSPSGASSLSRSVFQELILPYYENIVGPGNAPNLCEAL